MKLVFAAVAALMLPACSTLGEAGLDGAFLSSPAPSEIRYMPHPGYGLSAMDVAFMGKEAMTSPGYQSIHPDASGAFSTGRYKVVYHTPPMKAPKPAYWLSFSNEKDVLYGMGQAKTGFDYRIMDVAGVNTLDRTKSCWLIRSGEFVYPPEGENRTVILKITVEKNPDTAKACTEAPPN